MLVSKGLQGFSSVRLRREVYLAGALALDGLQRVARGKALGTIAKLPLTESDLFHGSAERIPGDGGVLLERGDVKPCLGNRREDLTDAVVELHGLGRTAPAAFSPGSGARTASDRVVACARWVPLSSDQLATELVGFVLRHDRAGRRGARGLSSAQESALLRFMLSLDGDDVVRVTSHIPGLWVTGLCPCGCPTILLAPHGEAQDAQAEVLFTETWTKTGVYDIPHELLLFTHPGGWPSSLELVTYGDAIPTGFPALEAFDPPRRRD